MLVQRTDTLGAAIHIEHSNFCFMKNTVWSVRFPEETDRSIHSITACLEPLGLRLSRNLPRPPGLERGGVVGALQQDGIRRAKLEVADATQGNNFEGGGDDAPKGIYGSRCSRGRRKMRSARQNGERT